MHCWCFDAKGFFVFYVFVALQCNEADAVGRVHALFSEQNSLREAGL